MSHAILCSRSEIKIENNVLLGGGVKIFAHDFYSVSYEERMQNGDSDVRTAPILIKEGAFIGAHAIILKGVTIGRHSVIGAGAVVTKDVPDNEVWAGNPAKRLIRENKIDIVHMYNTLSLVSPSVYYAAFACRKPVIQTGKNFCF